MHNVPRRGMCVRLRYPRVTTVTSIPDGGLLLPAYPRYSPAMLPPMVERELRVALLRRKARQQWMIAAWSAGGICLCFLLFLGLTSPRTMGRTLFGWLFALGCGGVLSRGFGLTADLFSEERRNGTLGLLVLTGMRPLEIFVNKLLGAGLLAAYALLGGLPFFALPFLMGGISAAQFLCAFVFLANGLLFCVAVGLLASVLHREGGQAQITAVALTAVLSLATPLMRWFSASASGASLLGRGWLALSPAYPPYLVFTNFAGSSPRLFWIGSGITLCYSLTALLAAAAVLQRTWREGPETLAPQGWRERWQRWARGSEVWRRRLRARLLLDHPFCWLAARDRRAALFAQAFLGMAALLWLAGWRARGLPWLNPGTAFASSIVLHLCFNWILAYAAGRRLAQERQSGGFEVLLTTPLQPAAIVDGQCKALLVQFRSVWLTVLVFDVVLCGSGFAAPGWSAAVTVIYLAAWCVLVAFWFAKHLETASRAMWISAWTGRPAYAAIQAIKPTVGILVWVWLVSATRGLSRRPTNALAAVFVLALSSAVFASFRKRRVLREKLARELRLIACAPIPARGDKRFRKWDPDRIFPPGRWGEFQLFPAKPRRSR
jgi:ABC-type Na+ efflux pump permease subunit